jgi:replicative DNA helicase
MTLIDQGSRISARVPPHSTEAEESVLGSILLSSDAANEVLDRLGPEDFYVPAHQAIFEAIAKLYNENRPIDAVTVADTLRRAEELDKVGGVNYLTSILDAVPTAANINYYADVVEEHGLRRRMLRAGAEIGELALQLDEEIETVIDTAEQKMLAVAEKRMGEGLEPLGELFKGTLEDLEALESRDSDLTGVSTGLVDLDKKLAGLQKANLVIVAGRPSMGKSSLAMNIATHVALKHGPVAIFSLEMARSEIVQRLLCSYGRIDSMKLRTGQLGSKWPDLVKAANHLYKAPIYVDDAAQVTVTDIRAKCRRLKRKSGLELVVVDYIQLMQGSNRENRQQEIAEISRNLKNLARELDVPVIGVSQLNRGLESRTDKRPQLGDLRESGAIEQDADVVMFIYRDEYYNPESQERGIADIIISKHRAGATGTVKTTFAAEYTKFANLPHGHTSQLPPPP